MTPALRNLLRTLSFAAQDNKTRVMHQTIALIASSLALVYGANTVTQYDGALSIPIYDEINFISVDVDIGSPSQSVRLLLDTGSDISWVVSPENPYCEPAIGDSPNDPKIDPQEWINCHKNGLFECRDSATCEQTKEEFTIKYGDATSVHGVYSSDVFTVGDGGVPIEYDFGLSKATNSSFGVFALGIPSPELKKGIPTYRHQNYAMRLKEEGIIERAVFNVWLNDGDDSSGELLFGAIDTAKFVPPLLSMKFVTEDGSNKPLRRFDVVLSGISVRRCINTDPEELFNMAEDYEGRLITALPDTGSRMTYLPQPLYEAILSLFDESIQLSENRYAVECPTNGTISFKFGTSSVNVPLSHFITDKNWALPRLSMHPQYDPRRKYCMFGFMPRAGDKVVLGHAFFRSVYTVFDLDMMQLLVAPAVYTANSNIELITLANNFISVPDGVLEDGNLASPEMLDPSVDFIPDTSSSFYKLPYANGGIPSPHRTGGALGQIAQLLLVVLWLSR